ncbi:MAG: S46 family peptidase [Rhizobiaceae bacterium]|nr:S46 family peptidase [Rhizobiaceae bacterium]
MIRALATALALVVASGAAADEGLWTFENFPADAVRAAHGFAPDQTWLDRVRAATLSLGGCTASIVSARGLVMTNHHCVEACVAALASPDQDVLVTPVLARTEADEKTCPGQEAYVVTDISDVTARIRAVQAGLAAVQAAAARSAEIDRIVAECERGDAYRWCEVAGLYSGGVETLYGYRLWDDVRLVLAPESAAGSFGGDPDNFSFPRFAYDVAFLRLYENGEPAATPQHLKVRPTPLSEGEMLFVSGFPGETGRADTLMHMTMYTDTYYPMSMSLGAELRGRLIAAMANGAKPRGFDALLAGTENNFKREWTEMASLRSPGFLEAMAAREAQFKADLAARPDVAAKVSDAWSEIDTAMLAARRIFNMRYLSEYAGAGATLAFQARQIVRAAGERKLPEEDRLPGYSDAAIADLRSEFEHEAPVYAERDELLLGFWLAKLREYLSADHPMVRAALGRESPEGVAARAISQTGLVDAAERVRLLDGGADAVAASTDPLIRLMAAIEFAARDVAARYHEEVIVPREAAERRLNEARFEIYGKAIYPDAFSTLRLNPGVVAGWTEPDGRVVPSFTRFSGLLERATDAAPFKLAPLWEAAKDRLDPDTILNVSTDNDTVGGNSGSPVLDRDGNVVAAMFDGNIYSNGGYYLFDPKLNRSVVVAATAILEGLAKVYDMDRVVSELTAE